MDYPFGMIWIISFILTCISIILWAIKGGAEATSKYCYISIPAKVFIISTLFFLGVCVAVSIISPPNISQTGAWGIPMIPFFVF